MTTIYKTIACKFDQSIEHGLIDAPLKGEDAAQFRLFMYDLWQSAKRKMPSDKDFYNVRFTRQDQCDVDNATCAITKQPSLCYVYRIDFEFSSM